MAPLYLVIICELLDHHNENDWPSVLVNGSHLRAQPANQFCEVRGANDHARASARRCEAGYPSETPLVTNAYPFYAVMEKFIEGVRIQPCLWNPLDPDYREMHVKDDAWTTVVEFYNNRSIPNIQVAKMEWKKLRDNHRDALKRAKLGKNKLLPAQITTWKYAKAMQFLEPHMKYRITENIEIEPHKTHEDTTTDDYFAKRRCIESKQDGALESFFKCMLQSTKMMPNWMQTQVKKKIFNIIIEAEEHLSSQGQSEVGSEYESEQTIPLGIVKTEINTDSDDYS